MKNVKAGNNMLGLFKTKKEKGSIDHFLPGYILIVVVFILFMSYINVSSVITIRDNADVIAREYMLKMESRGWLDGTSTKNLVTKIDALEASGVKVENVKVAGSVEAYDASVVTSGVTGPVGYANTVILDIKADIVDAKNGKSTWGIPIFASNYKLHIRKESTAKY